MTNFNSSSGKVAQMFVENVFKFPREMGYSQGYLGNYRYKCNPSRVAIPTDLPHFIQKRCGNGVIGDTTTELCDDANILNGDGCNNVCGYETVCGVDKFGKSICSCGNGIRESWEYCDDGLAGMCNKYCTGNNLGWYCSGPVGSLSTCVNHTADAHTVGPEQCDDGNMVNGDGCSGNLIDFGWTCSLDLLLTSHCMRYCGDGKIDF